MHDRVGIGWRPELAASIFSNLDKIDLVEIIADDLFSAPKGIIRSIETLSTQVPITLHGVGMGLASIEPVEDFRFERMAKLVQRLQPDCWSEHLAFVRAGGYEIGHLAAPPRTKENILGAIQNIERAKQIIGSAPILENIATLIDPPCSEMSESAWVNEILTSTSTSLLLDLHNLYANALNFGHSPEDYLLSFPLEKVRIVHLSGGHWIKEPSGRGMRLLDDHIHDVPNDVFELLKLLSQKTTQPLTVILERDGSYPDFDVLLSQVSRARDALAQGKEVSEAIGAAI